MKKRISSSGTQLHSNGGTICGKLDVAKLQMDFFLRLIFTRLSEGFATLLSYQVTEQIHPEWQPRHFFNIRAVHNAFRYDSRDVARSMTPTPSLVTPAEIRSSFDTIAYDKCKKYVSPSTKL